MVTDFLTQLTTRLDSRLSPADHTVPEWRIRMLLGFEDVARQLPIQKAIVEHVMRDLGYRASGRRFRIWHRPAKSTEQSVFDD